jgi:heme exporter protein A
MLSDLSFSAVNLTCVRAKRPLFQRLGFKLQAGEALYIKGENGAGKTSLLRLLAGLGEPERGDIYWCGQKIRSVAESFNINRLFLGHQNNLNPVLTPLENIKISWGLEKNKVLPNLQIEEAFDALGFKLKDVPCYTLSLGQKRRVALTRLILSQAKLWLLDEPFTGLDSAGVQLIKNLILTHLNQGGMVVYSSHLEQDLNTYVYQL